MPLCPPVPCYPVFPCTRVIPRSPLPIVLVHVPPCYPMFLSPLCLLVPCNPVFPCPRVIPCSPYYPNDGRLSAWPRQCLQWLT